MAEKIDTYEVDIETGESIAKIRELTQENKALVKEMNELDVSTEEGADRFKELSAAVSENNRNIQILKENVKDANKEIVAQDKYGKGLKSTLTETKNAYLQAGGGIRGMTAAAKTFIATPLGAALALITGAFALFKKALEKSEKGQRVLAKVTGTVTGALRTLGNTLVDVGKLLKDVFTGNWKQLGSDIDEIKNSFSQLGSNIKEGINEELDKLEEKPEKISEKIDKAAEQAAKRREQERQANQKLLNDELSDMEDFYLSKDELAKKSARNEYDQRVANFDKLLEAGTINQQQYDEMVTKAAAIRNEKIWMIDEERRQAELDAEAKKLDEQEKLEKKAADKKEAERIKQAEAEENAQKALLDASFSATSSTLKAISDLTGKENKKAFEFSKGLEIADATVSTIKGAVGAFAQASSAYPPPYGQIIGGITAGAVTASGLANIAKIKATKYGSGSSASASTPKSVNINSSLPESTTSKISGMQGDLALSTVTPSVSSSSQDQMRTVLVVDDVTAKQASQSKIAQITSVS